MNKVCCFLLLAAWTGIGCFSGGNLRDDQSRKSAESAMSKVQRPPQPVEEDQVNEHNAHAMSAALAEELDHATAEDFLPVPEPAPVRGKR
jgi:hypothetical protein